MSNPLLCLFRHDSCYSSVIQNGKSCVLEIFKAVPPGTVFTKLMKTYIIFLRGINVGGRNLLPMKALVALLEKKGFKDVKTYIQSGNIILRNESRPETDVSSLIESEFKFKPETLTLEKSELDTAIKLNPYSATENKLIHFWFCKKPPHPDIGKLKAFALESEAYQLIQNVFYLHAPNGIGRSKLAAKVETCLGVPTTTRNLNTVLKVQKIAQNL